MYLGVDQCVPVYLGVHQCVPVYLDVHQCVPVYLDVHMLPGLMEVQSVCTENVLMMDEFKDVRKRSVLLQ